MRTFHGFGASKPLCYAGVRQSAARHAFRRTINYVKTFYNPGLEIVSVIVSSP